MDVRLWQVALLYNGSVKQVLAHVLSYFCKAKSSLMRLANDASGHQFLDQIPKAMVLWLLYFARLVSTTDNVMHFARLIKQTSADLV